MPLLTKQVDIVHERIATSLNVELERVVPEANYFTELGGTTELLTPLRDSLNKAFGIEIEIVTDTIHSKIQLEDDDKLSDDSLFVIKSYLGRWSGAPLEPTTLSQMFTIAIIEAIVAKAIELTAKYDALPSFRDGAYELLAWPFERSLHFSFDATTMNILQAFGGMLGRLRELCNKLKLRESRLLVIAMTRYIIQQQHHNWGYDENEAFKVLEGCADSGKDLPKKWQNRDLWGWARGGYGQRALHILLCKHDEPKAALLPLLELMKGACEIFDQEAFERLQFVHSDLQSASLDSQEFDDSWRTTEIVELAQSMYVASEFSEIVELADLLEKAGCQNSIVLSHCREPNGLHFRGCWVVDAILDGNWKPTKKRATKVRKKTIMSMLAKRDQYEIKQLMENQDNQLPLVELIAKYVDSDSKMRKRSFSHEQIARLDAHWNGRFPDWTDDQIKLAQSLEEFREKVGDHLAIARRIWFEDPAELGRLLSLICRSFWLHYLLFRDIEITWVVLHACAVRDFELVQLAADSAWATDSMEQSDEFLVYLAVLAAVKNDANKLRSLISKMQQQSGTKEFEAMTRCFHGISEKDPNLVTQGLQQLVDTERRAREKMDFGIVYLSVHSMYRLCERTSPNLVTDFDTHQEKPWDAQFHQWCDGISHPLEWIGSVVNTYCFSGVRRRTTYS